MKYTPVSAINSKTPDEKTGNQREDSLEKDPGIGSGRWKSRRRNNSKLCPHIERDDWLSIITKQECLLTG